MSGMLDAGTGGGGGGSLDADDDPWSDDSGSNVTDSSDVDRQTYSDVASGDGSESGSPGAGTPQADIVSPDPNENTDGDSVGVDDDGTAVFDPDQSERESEERNTIDEGSVTDGTTYVDASGDEPETVTAGENDPSNETGATDDVEERLSQLVEWAENNPKKVGIGILGVGALVMGGQP